MVYLAEYSFWGVLREKVYRSKIADVNEKRINTSSKILTILNRTVISTNNL